MEKEIRAMPAAALEAAKGLFKPRAKRWVPLDHCPTYVERMLARAARRGLCVVISTIHGPDHRRWGYVVYVDGSSGSARGLAPAIARAYQAWNRDNRPNKKREKR